VTQMLSRACRTRRRRPHFRPSKGPSMDAAGGWPDLIHRAVGELRVRQVVDDPRQR
jgi:hypothetical protein